MPSGPSLEVQISQLVIRCNLLLVTRFARDIVGDFHSSLVEIFEPPGSDRMAMACPLVQVY